MDNAEPRGRIGRSEGVGDNAPPGLIHRLAVLFGPLPRQSVPGVGGRPPKGGFPPPLRQFPWRSSVTANDSAGEAEAHIGGALPAPR